PLEFFKDCVVVDQGSVGLDVLDAVLDVRAADSGLICGIAGYPSEECGAEIDISVLSGPEEEPLSIEKTGENEAASNNSFALIGLAVIALLAGVVALRRRSAK
ncbi:MAG: LPXTG cell wall anchor domain-containing protein, partial [Actinomycetota bacterium]